MGHKVLDSLNVKTSVAILRNANGQQHQYDTELARRKMALLVNLVRSPLFDRYAMMQSRNVRRHEKDDAWLCYLHLSCIIIKPIEQFALCLA
jgi:hypothetical protein